jgi:hypothetical protein
VGSKAAFDILPSGRLRWIVSISSEPLIEKPPMLFTRWKLFRITAAAQLHDEPIQELFLLLQRESFKRRFEFGERCHERILARGRPR